MIGDRLKDEDLMNAHAQPLERIDRAKLSTRGGCQASALAIQSWSGSFLNRHFRIGPAMTFR